MQDGHNGNFPNAIDITDLPEVSVVPPWTHNIPPLSRVGFKLAIFILCIISGFILFLIIFLSTAPIDGSGRINITDQVNVPDSVFANKLQLLHALREEKKGYRDFIMQISQMILLNLLLPTLTAILGYIFGSKEALKNSDTDNVT